jgi:hypothetical protein
MSAIGKSDKGYRKIDRVVDKGLALGQKKLVIAHKFSSAGLTDIDLTNLTVPSEMSAIGFTNPSTAQILAANLYNLRDNIRVLSSSNGPLADYLSYDVVSNTLIRLKGGAVSQVGEIIIIYVEQVNMTGLIAVDAQAIVQTGTVSVGTTDIVLSSGYFTYNKYPTQQTGDVLLILDGLVQMRNVGNAVSGQGNYYEVAPGSGNLSNTLRLNNAPVGSAKNYIVISNGLVAERPTAAVLGAVQTLAATVDKVVQDLAVVTGNPTSNYQASPSSVDQAMFGNKVNSYISGIHYDAVVGSAAQLAAGQVTHTSVASAIASQPQGRILILAGTYAENITLTSANNNLMLEGKGRGSFINGTLSLTSSATGLNIKWLRFGGNISIASGCNNTFMRECWQTTGLTITDSGTANSKLIIQE